MIAFDTAEDKNVFLAVTAATSLAFFAMVGFEDSVNMAEEIKDPVKIFPKMLLSGLGIAGVVYIVVAVVAVALVPVGDTGGQRDAAGRGGQGRGAGPADREDPAVHLDVRGGEHRTDQHADGQPADLRHGRQHVLPPVLGVVHPTRRTPWVAIIFTTTIAFGLIIYVTAFANDSAISVLGGTTSLLLLAVFAVVNVAVLVLRRDVQAAGGHSRRRPRCRSSGSWRRCIW